MEQAQSRSMELEIKRRQLQLDKLKQDETALSQRVAEHRKNLGNGMAAPAKVVPRHVEIAPQVSAALTSMSIEAYREARHAGKLPDVVREAREIVPAVPINNLMLKAFCNNAFRINAPDGAHPWSLDNNPQFWSEFSETLQAYDDVRVVGHGWVADFIVTHKAERIASAMLFAYLAIPVQEHAPVSWLPGTHRLKWLDAGSMEVGCVIERIHDGLEMRSSGKPFEREEDARRFWLDHSINRPAEIINYLP